MPDEISTTEAAELLKVTRQRVLQLIEKGRLEARKIGYYYAITRRSVEAYQEERNKSDSAK